MADEPESLVLQLLRKLDAKVDRIVEDVADLKLRMTQVEERFASMEVSMAGIQRRIDRVEQRLDRIEKRLDMADSPYGGVRE